MLRITRLDMNATAVKLKVEGRIASDWVAEVERECQHFLATGRSVVLDLSDVTFIDRRGARVLRTLRTGQLGIVNCPALIRDLLDSPEPV
jgi:anti-anti-sigma regulatory factor